MRWRAEVVLDHREWNPGGGSAVVCVHGIAQRGAVFGEMAEQLAGDGRRVVAVDLRGHGSSSAEPPWTIAAHVADLVESAEALGLESATWVGHSFGARLCAELAAGFPRSVSALALLEPAFDVPAARARQAALIEAMDWSFETVEGAANAVLAAETSRGADADAVTAYVREDVSLDGRGRYRFSHSGEAVAGSWEAMTGPDPEIAERPTLLLRAAQSHLDWSRTEDRYREALGPLLSSATVPGGHNVFWSAPQATTSTVAQFLAEADSAPVSTLPQTSQGGLK
ncbi:MAG TPA: alpha/beta hydrolase [Solirubrobacterales bacterium]|nr:alpha/beta hydrolase [Solirubrobacterales bacterium]